MKTLQALKTRRIGIEKINKIARAMEVVAATRLRRNEQRALRFRPYIAAQQSLVQNLALRLRRINSSWTEPLAERKKGLVLLISSDRGFCGGFNNQLFQLIDQWKSGDNLSCIVVGKKGALCLKRRHVKVVFESALPGVGQLDAVAQTLSEKLLAFYREQGQGIYLIFNQFRRNLLGRGFIQQLLPLPIPPMETMILDYLFEPDAQVVVEDVLSLYIRSAIKAAILESQAAEEMARMVAMTQATRSAGDLIKGLTLQYHKARQTGITKELTEIVNAVR